MTVNKSAPSPKHRQSLTVVDCFGPKDLKFSLDVWVKVFDKVEMIGQFLPFDEVLNPVLMPNVTFASNVGDRLSVGMDGCKEQAKIRHVSA